MSRWRVGLAISLLALLLPLVEARADATQIRFLNPSGYSPTITISDKPDRDQSVHIAAWVQSVPANPLVEFELQPTVGASITIDATRTSDDTWEAFQNLSNQSDGTYTLKAILYSNLIEVASTAQEVTLNRADLPPPPAAETVEFSYPPSGGQLGFFRPAGKTPNALLDVVVSDGTDQVRALYTLSLPGTEPAWVECGSEAVSNPTSVRVRCTLAANASIQQVTAVAVVANNTPSTSDPNPVADATGDAHRVFPYVQAPSDLSLDPEATTSDISSCQLFTARASDQFLRPIAGANLDVHVVGPNDQVRFGTIERTTSPTASQLTSGFQAPDKAHVSQQDGINCANKERAGRQGDHNIPGANDPQHIESSAGTNDEGKFYFAIYSDSSGGSAVTAWLDDDDDDTLDAPEASGGARVGWGQAPPPPTTELFFDPRSSAAASGSCVRIVLAVKSAGNPLAGVNVDVHASGPDASVAFCLTTDATSSRPPDQAHVGGSDDDTTRHLEGETNSSGQFIFGVTSASMGATQLVGWLDAFDDDLQDGSERSTTGSVQWDISGQRKISIQANKYAVRKGRSVRITGTIDGAAACESTQTVKLKVKRLNGGRFRTLATTTTDTEGGYLFNMTVQSSKRYKAKAPAADVCQAAVSSQITVRAT